MFVIQGDIILPAKFYNDLKLKFCFLYAHDQCMSELCPKFQIPASNTTERVAETRTVLQCDMIKICMSFKGTYGRLP